MQAWLPQETEVELAQEAAEVGNLILAATDRCSQGGWRVQPHSNTIAAVPLLAKLFKTH